MLRSVVLALLLTACSASAPTPPATSSGDERVASGPIAGFVLYDGARTVIVPSQGDPVTLLAWWLLDETDASAPVVLRWAEEPPPDSMRCQCDEDRERGCLQSGWTRTSFDASGAVASFRASDSAETDCPCYVESERDEEEDDDDPCGDLASEMADPEWVSFTGGTLYSFGGILDNEGCSGVHVVDSYGLERALVPGSRASIAPRAECYARVFYGTEDPRTSLAGARCTGPAADAPDDDDDEPDPCDACADNAGDEAGALYLRNGTLTAVGTNASVFWELTYIESTPLTAANCPGPNDPCGDPSAFDGIAERGDYWIATDGSFALFVHEGVTNLWPRGGVPRAAEIDALSLLGVRFHADVRPLLRMAAVGFTPPGGDPDLADCDADHVDEQAWAGPVDDDEIEPSDVEDLEDAPEALAPEDEGFVDTRGGRDWGNRCFAHVRASELDAATAACTRGLLMATEPDVIGALLYNVGRIAEAAGNVPGAISAYERSLAVRPGNRTVRARLDALR